MPTIVFEKDIDRYYEAVGRIEDNKGNAFRVFLTSTRKAHVEDYIQRLKEGKAEIKVTVKRIKAESDQPVRRRKPASDVPATTDKFDMGYIRIGISRINEIKANSVIHYEIDPELAKNEHVTVTFDHQDTAQMACEVTQGQVEVELFEQMLDATWLSRGIKDVLPGPGNAVEMTERKLDTAHIGNWAVTVTGLSPISAFTLSYDKLVA